MPDAQRVVFGRTMVELARSHDDFVLLDGDLANSTRADILAEEVPDRFIELGIAEQNLVGVAAGLATVGFRPWLSSFAVFLVNRDLDQVRMLVAQNGLPVRLAGAYSGLWTGYTGKTHQCVEDLAVMRALPGMTVLAPADASEARLALHYAHTLEGPVYVRLCRDSVADVTDPAVAYDPRVGVWLRRGDALTLVSTGVQSTRAADAADRLAARGIAAGVLHVRALKPLPEADLVQAARIGPIVTVEEHSILGGLGGAVAELVSEVAPTPVLRLGITDRFGASGDNESLLVRYGLDPESVAERAATFFRSWS